MLNLFLVHRLFHLSSPPTCLSILTRTSMYLFLLWVSRNTPFLVPLIKVLSGVWYQFKLFLDYYFEIQKNSLQKYFKIKTISNSHFPCKLIFPFLFSLKPNAYSRILNQWAISNLLNIMTTIKKILIIIGCYLSGFISLNY